MVVWLELRYNPHKVTVSKFVVLVFACVTCGARVVAAFV